MIGALARLEEFGAIRDAAHELERAAAHEAMDAAARLHDSALALAKAA